MLLSLLASVIVANTPTYSVNRIAYDSHSLIIDGKPTFIYSGAFHYFRCPKALWRDRFQKIKDAGLNTVETYVAWNWHERTAPKSPDDFSKVDMTDLKDWLKMAHEDFGLYTIIRPGPYICAEWAAGGYPRWLLALRPASVPNGRWLRGDEKSYLAWSKHWYDAVCKVVAPEQISRKKAGSKGTILFQIENEYDYWGGATDQQRKNQLKALYDDARSDVIDVPIIGCWTHEMRGPSVLGLKGAFDSSNLYNRHDIDGAGNSIDSLKGAQKDAPGMVTELQGGWFAQVRGSLSEDQGGIGPDQIRAITLECIARGASILNYYMFFGGTHFGDWGAKDLTTTYDYFAPIREWGAVGAKHAEVTAIGQMLSKYGADIAVSNLKEVANLVAPDDIHAIVREGPKGVSFVFLRNSNEKEARKGTATMMLRSGSVITVPIDLKPFGSDVLLVPVGTTGADARSICVTPEIAKRPATPAPTRIKEVMTREDNGPTTWLTRKPGQTLTSILGRDQDTALSVYRETLSLTKEDLQKIGVLSIDLYNNDACTAMINGNLVKSIVSQGRRVSFDVVGSLHEGNNEILALYEDQGNPNGGTDMGNLTGIIRGFLTSPASDTMVTEWRVKVLPEATSAKSAGEDIDDSNWDRLVLDRKTIDALSGNQPTEWPIATVLNGKRAGAMYRAHFNLTKEQIEAGVTALSFDRIDDLGTVYVNGRKVGSHDQWDVPFTVDAKDVLREGDNLVAIYVVNTDGDGGLTRGVRLSQADSGGIAVPFSQVNSLTNGGTDWTASALDVSGSIERKGGKMPQAANTALVTWTRAEFELPAQTKGVWIPWRLLVRASGNGEMFLNGHSIGRYWEVGPQREFFLPECWLNFGKGKKNTLTFCLWQTDNGAKVEALEVSPYPDSAEFRK